MYTVDTASGKRVRGLMLNIKSAYMKKTKPAPLKRVIKRKGFDSTRVIKKKKYKKKK